METSPALAWWAAVDWPQAFVLVALGLPIVLVLCLVLLGLFGVDLSGRRGS